VGRRRCFSRALFSWLPFAATGRGWRGRLFPTSRPPGNLREPGRWSPTPRAPRAGATSAPPPSRSPPACSTSSLPSSTCSIRAGPWSSPTIPAWAPPVTKTYNVGIAEGRAVLDALRAATRVPGAGLQPSAPMAIEGYSQGGGAADWAAQLHPTYAPELHLAGVAGGGTPANLQAVAATSRHHLVRLPRRHCDRLQRRLPVPGLQPVPDRTGQGGDERAGHAVPGHRAAGVRGQADRGLHRGRHQPDRPAAGESGARSQQSRRHQAGDPGAAVSRADRRDHPLAGGGQPARAVLRHGRGDPAQGISERSRPHACGGTGRRGELAARPPRRVPRAAQLPSGRLSFEPWSRRAGPRPAVR
jgi:hypothetical protein